MGRQWLERIVTLLTEAGIRAGAEYPAEAWTQVLEPVAAVGLEGLDTETGKAKIRVQILSPRSLGGWECQCAAVNAAQVLLDGGFHCQGGSMEYLDGSDCFAVTLTVQVPLYQTEDTVKLKFRMFTWPENPETFGIEAVREPLYTINADGTITYDGLAPLCRVVTGRGAFYGEYAAQSFNALAVLMAHGEAGELVHPIWGTMNAYLIELNMTQESREDYVAYTFAFREASEDGTIPPLPGIEEDLT